MALYAFDGTGDSWSPRNRENSNRSRYNPKNLRNLDDSSKKELLDTITSDAKTDKDRYLTNVVFFYKEYIKSGGHAEYFSGVGSGALFGSETGKTLDFIFGGAFGIGALGIVNRAFKKLIKNFQLGDYDIDIIGYSRGAAIARVFADKTFSDYKTIVDKNGNKLTSPPPIRFVGLFDTVASFGNPLNDNELFFQEHLPMTANNVFHAMSLDLKKKGFGLDRAYGENVLEVWFRGGHGDIGGNSKRKNGEPNRERTNISLIFMLKKFAAVLNKEGLNSPANLKEEKLNKEYPADINSEVDIDGNNLKEDLSRQPLKYDIFHYSFFDQHGEMITFSGCSSLPEERSKIVIEELKNESQVSKQLILQLTPELQNKYPDSQSIYNKLYE